ncbi:hypothetical protein CDCA_CDCA01G0056 [Cyanidium caldarium]|uniref:Uncharacterized protein n=1 Tax=Cyanidium caldarium TaxID=2771 RepID=A0AAV9IPN7_CYACA|nr:hypothetical protein CDCA_CDCA01G0056 [Cyanidium caldarium]
MPSAFVAAPFARGVAPCPWRTRPGGRRISRVGALISPRPTERRRRALASLRMESTERAQSVEQSDKTWAKDRSKDPLIWRVLHPGQLPTTIPTDFWYRCVDGSVDSMSILMMVWQSLGYTFDPNLMRWRVDAVAPEWLRAFPADHPPDFIGCTEWYSPDDDATVQRAADMLQGCIPPEYQNILREQLPQFPGVGESASTPQMHRRVQCVAYLLAKIAQQELEERDKKWTG